MFLSKKKAGEQTASAVSAVEDRYARQVAELQGDIALLTSVLQTHREDVSLMLDRMGDTIKQVRRDIPEIPPTPVIPDLGPLTRRVDEVDDTVAYLLDAPVFSAATVQEITQLGRVLADSAHQWVRRYGE